MAVSFGAQATDETSLKQENLSPFEQCAISFSKLVSIFRKESKKFRSVLLIIDDQQHAMV